MASGELGARTQLGEKTVYKRCFITVRGPGSKPTAAAPGFTCRMLGDSSPVRRGDGSAHSMSRSWSRSRPNHKELNGVQHAGFLPPCKTHVLKSRGPVNHAGSRPADV